jgi:hypothetical protein
MAVQVIWLLIVPLDIRIHRTMQRQRRMRFAQGYVKVNMSTQSRPAGRIEGCGPDPFTPFDTRFALLRTLTPLTLTYPCGLLPS